jgi:hypothetical protein
MCDKRYRNYSWAIFNAIEKYCRLKEVRFVSCSTPHIPPFIHSFTRQFSQGGYATVMHVDRMPVVPLDQQERFFWCVALSLSLLFLQNDII